MRRTAAGTTFHGLILLLKLCPHFRSFHMVIDATKLDGLRSDKPGGGVYNRWVKCVNLVGSPIGDPEVVARILLDILPELESVFGSNTLVLSQERPEGWIRVQEIINAAKEATAAGPVTLLRTPFNNIVTPSLTPFLFLAFGIQSLSLYLHYVFVVSLYLCSSPTPGLRIIFIAHAPTLS